MNIEIDPRAGALLVGAGATALTDLWTAARKWLFGMPAPNYGLVGRWLGHMPRGRFRHASIAMAQPVQGERFIGWTAHYLIGIAFACLLLGIWGLAWLEAPTIGPAMWVGIGTVAAPFLLMQPGMGAGIAARGMPRPAIARLNSLTTHFAFGLGLYAAGWATHFVIHSGA